eukprot:TRINITY_DN3375_c0_g1_i2.p1 TRINITY_DN3375_c0_g1~~TRINITY_DN3375_c0_g1_i2.p1  ORF type:complete len:383 (+),score=157.87 TRINITY_DN3375_c0_g1_i2:619-1767(+)
MAQDMLSVWQTRLDQSQEQGQEQFMNIGRDLVQLTLEVISHTIFGQHIRLVGGPYDDNATDAHEKELRDVLTKLVDVEVVDKLSEGEPGSLLMRFLVSENEYVSSLIPLMFSAHKPFLQRLNKVVFASIDKRRARIQEAKASKEAQETEDEEGEEEAQDMLELLIEAQDSESGETMADSQIKDEMMTFLIAGHDTTAHTMSWVLYHVSKNPQVEAKLLQEIDTVLAERDVPKFEDLSKLKYLANVINETLRLTPTVPQLARKTKRDVMLDSYLIPQGTVVLTSPYFLHHNQSSWENLEEFNPERFNDRGSKNEGSSSSFIPFSTGPRSCIGKNFALLEMKLVLATIFKKYTFRLNTDKYPVKRMWRIVSKPKLLMMKPIKRT